MVVFICIIAVIIIILWAVLHPGHVTQAQRDMVYGISFAHRGLHIPDKSIPENSLMAFKAASAAGYGIELDIQLSRDSYVVVFHDDTLPRVTGKTGRVDDYLLTQLKKFHLCGTNEQIPLLTEVLDVVAGRVPIIIELKTGPRNTELCEKAMQILDSYEGVYCIESFDPRIVAWFKKHRPIILRGQLSDSTANFKDQPKIQAIALGNLLTNIIARPQFIAYGSGKKSIFVKLVEYMGAIKVRWTVHPENDVEQINEDNDAVIFEFYMPEVKYK
ncbi:MAG: glycerophosphodiester phosphodiesterase [Clostridia bacterium]|nr:glycerophosphodiester phosphodiesterase [Clostridia bacterium]NLS86115.1 glycerophosphodiester phosphodiesterase [Oscillospiraceae bacterium]